MTMTLLVFTDGRECVRDTLESARYNLLCDTISRRVIVNDSMAPEHAELLRRIAPDFEIHTHPRKLGFGGSIAAAWRELLDDDNDWVFHLEDDFLFNYRVPLQQMLAVMASRPTLAQVALKRQPWNEQETLAGGLMNVHPEAWTTHEEYVPPLLWSEQKMFFTTNPCVYRKELTHRGWPEVEHSEGVFSHQLIADGFRFAMWGQARTPPFVHHIGHVRVGTGY